MKIESGREEVIRYSYICDLCGKGTEHHRVCSICSRDLCSNCTKFDPRDMGDYPEKYCYNCFKVGDKYLRQISIEEEKCETIVEKLEQEWRDEALESIKSTEEGKNVGQT